MITTTRELKEYYNKFKQAYKSYKIFLTISKETQENFITALKNKTSNILKLYKTDDIIKNEIQKRMKLLKLINKELKKEF